MDIEKALSLLKKEGNTIEFIESIQTEEAYEDAYHSNGACGGSV